MKTLDHYLKDWALSEPDKIATTFTSDVYKVRREDGTPAVLKILNDIGVKFEKDSILYLKLMDGNGTVQLYQYDDQALLLEYAVGEELRTLVDSGHDKKATEIAGNVIKNLHTVEDLTHADKFWTMEKNAEDLLKADTSTHALIDQVKQIFNALLQSTTIDNTRILHRDVHHMNILKSDRGWLAIDPQPVVGDRHYECAMFFLNPTGYRQILDINRIQTVEDIFCSILDLDRNRLRHFVFCHMMLSACWCIKNEQDPSFVFKFAELIHNKI